MLPEDGVVARAILKFVKPAEAGKRGKREAVKGAGHLIENPACAEQGGRWRRTEDEEGGRRGASQGKNLEGMAQGGQRVEQAAQRPDVGLERIAVPATIMRARVNQGGLTGEPQEQHPGRTACARSSQVACTAACRCASA